MLPQLKQKPDVGVGLGDVQQYQPHQHHNQQQQYLHERQEQQHQLQDMSNWAEDEEGQYHNGIAFIDQFDNNNQITNFFLPPSYNNIDGYDNNTSPIPTSSTAAIQQYHHQHYQKDCLQHQQRHHQQQHLQQHQQQQQHQQLSKNTDISTQFDWRKGCNICGQKLKRGGRPISHVIVKHMRMAHFSCAICSYRVAKWV